MITTVLKGKQKLLCLYHTATSIIMLELSLVKVMQANLVLPLVPQKTFPPKVPVSFVHILIKLLYRFTKTR